MSPEDNSSRGGDGKPPVHIFVNTRLTEWVEKQISYEQVYELAYPGQPLTEGDVARVEFSRGQGGGGGGSLMPGQSVNVKQGMVFDVYVTVRS